MASLPECPICVSSFSRPKILYCGHSFCLECIRRYIGKKNRFFKCPVCKKTIFIPKQGIDTFQTNYALDTSPETLIIDEQCRAKCLLHKDSVIDFFCKDCEIDACSKCILKDHKHHSYIDLEESSEEIILRYAHVREKLQHKIDSLDNTYSACEAAVTKLEEFKSQALQAVNEEISILAKQLLKMEEDVKKRIFINFDLNREKLTERKDEIMSQRERLRGFVPQITEKQTVLMLRFISSFEKSGIDTEPEDIEISYLQLEKKNPPGINTSLGFESVLLKMSDINITDKLASRTSPKLAEDTRSSSPTPKPAADDSRPKQNSSTYDTRPKQKPAADNSRPKQKIEEEKSSSHQTGDSVTKTPKDTKAQCLHKIPAIPKSVSQNSNAPQRSNARNIPDFFTFDLNKITNIGQQYYCGRSYITEGLTFKIFAWLNDRGNCRVHIKFPRKENPHIGYCVVNYRMTLLNKCKSKEYSKNKVRWMFHVEQDDGYSFVADKQRDPCQGFVSENGKFLMQVDIQPISKVRKELLFHKSCNDLCS